MEMLVKIPAKMRFISKVDTIKLGSLVIPRITKDGISEDDGQSIGCQEYGRVCVDVDIQR